MEKASLMRGRRGRAINEISHFQEYLKREGISHAEWEARQQKDAGDAETQALRLQLRRLQQKYTDNKNEECRARPSGKHYRSITMKNITLTRGPSLCGGTRKTYRAATRIVRPRTIRYYSLLWTERLERITRPYPQRGGLDAEGGTAAPIADRAAVLRTIDDLTHRIAVLRQAVDMQRGIVERLRCEIGAAIASEMLPQHTANVAAIVDAALQLSIALQAEKELRDSLTEQDIPFCSIIRGHALAGIRSRR